MIEIHPDLSTASKASWKEYPSPSWRGNRSDRGTSTKARSRMWGWGRVRVSVWQVTPSPMRQVDVQGPGPVVRLAHPAQSLLDGQALVQQGLGLQLGLQEHAAVEIGPPARRARRRALSRRRWTGPAPGSWAAFRSCPGPGPGCPPGPLNWFPIPVTIFTAIPPLPRRRVMVTPA